MNDKVQESLLWNSISVCKGYLGILGEKAYYLWGKNFSLIWFDKLLGWTLYALYFENLEMC